MKNNIIDSNKVSIIGKIVTDFEFIYEGFHEDFYRFNVSVNRLSNSSDIISIIISEKLVDIKSDLKGKYVEINGQFCSYNSHKDNKHSLILSLFAKEFRLCEEDLGINELNYIFLDGFICKQPIYRKTPLGREISDVFLAVNRKYGKTDYIPCICWGKNARLAKHFIVGDRIQIWGRIQSREYQKKVTDTNFEKKVAYEVSISKLTYLKE